MNLPTLYELTEKYRQLLSLDDIPEEALRDTLEAMEGDLQEKITNVAAVIRNFEATAEAIREAEKRMAERRKSMANRAELLRQYLDHCMKLCGIQKVPTPYFVVSIAKNPPAVKIEDESLIPLNYTRIPDPEIDKAAIKRDLLAGKSVPGAVLESGTRVEIR